MLHKKKVKKAKYEAKKQLRRQIEMNYPTNEKIYKTDIHTLYIFFQQNSSEYVKMKTIQTELFPTYSHPYIRKIIQTLRETMSDYTLNSYLIANKKGYLLSYDIVDIENYVNISISLRRVSLNKQDLEARKIIGKIKENETQEFDIDLKKER